MINTYGNSDEYSPKFVDPFLVELNHPTIALFTHSSSHFDPLRLTKPAVERVTSVMKRRGLPVIYLHDKHNRNNPWWGYLYRDWKPTAFVESEIGHHDFDFTKVRHVVSLGGFFWRCQKNTIADSIRLWRRDAPESDFRITQVVDGIYDVAEAVEGAQRDRIRKFQHDILWTQRPGASMTLEQILDLTDSDEACIRFLKRQLPALPEDVNVKLDLFGHEFVISKAKPIAADDSKSEESAAEKPKNDVASKDGESTAQTSSQYPTLTICYRTSDLFLGQSTLPGSRLRFSKLIGKYHHWPKAVGKIVSDPDSLDFLENFLAQPMSEERLDAREQVAHRRTRQRKDQ